MLTSSLRNRLFMYSLVAAGLAGASMPSLVGTNASTASSSFASDETPAALGTDQTIDEPTAPDPDPTVTDPIPGETAPDPDDGDNPQGGDQDTDGQDEARVTVCHIPPGNPANAHEITVGESSVGSHERHGDYQGTCEESEDGEVDSPGHGKDKKEAETEEESGTDSDEESAPAQARTQKGKDNRGGRNAGNDEGADSND